MLGYVEAVSQASAAEEVWSIHTQAMAEFGFDRLIYGFTRFRTSRSFGDPNDCIILTNHDPAYADVLVSERLYAQGPMVQWAAANVGACSWSWIAENFDALTEAEKKVVQFNRRHDVTVGYSISFNDASPRVKGAIALTARKGLTQDTVDRLWAAKGREIAAMNNIMHLKIMGLPVNSARRPLTKRQREALEWVGDGKTTQDIATIMGLTAATIEKHLRLAREALDVETTAQAVLKASVQNQIFVLEH